MPYARTRPPLTSAAHQLSPPTTLTVSCTWCVAPYGGGAGARQHDSPTRTVRPRSEGPRQPCRSMNVCSLQGGWRLAGDGHVGR